MSIKERQNAVDLAWQEARKAARKNLLSSPLVEDFKLSMADRAISAAGSQKALSRAMKELGLEGDITDYDAFQIQSILRKLKELERSDLMAPYKE
jgi:predicted nucleic acid-binding protein